MPQPFRILRVQPELGVAGLGVALIAVLWVVGWMYSAHGEPPLLRLAIMTGGIGIIDGII